MPYKPFLSHKSQDAAEIGQLREELCLRGAGGWQDAHDLRLGQRWRKALARAIGSETGGFIWYGTRRALTSDIIRWEIRSALRRATSRRRGSYPVVPIYVDLGPGDADLGKAFGRRTQKRLEAHQGVIREPDENVADLARRAAKRYVCDLVRTHPGDTIRVAITGNREPTGTHDLSLDWRRMLDADGRVHDPTVMSTLIATLADIRTAAQSRTTCPEIIVEPHLRLPLAALVGWEWNRVRPIRLTVMQPSPEGLLEVPDVPGDTTSLPDPATSHHGGDGPVVLAVSVGKDLGDGVRRYCEAQNARSSMHLHISLDGRRALTGEQIAGLATWTVQRLAGINAQVVEKHLLLLGPSSLAVRLGAAANGTGRTFVPFWDGGSGYASGVLIG